VLWILIVLMPIRIRLSILMPNTDPDPDPTQRYSHLGKLEEKNFYCYLHQWLYSVYIVFLSRQRQTVQ
jgi:hypothetical protein